MNEFQTWLMLVIVVTVVYNPSTARFFHRLNKPFERFNLPEVIQKEPDFVASARIGRCGGYCFLLLIYVGERVPYPTNWLVLIFLLPFAFWVFWEVLKRTESLFSPRRSADIKEDKTKQNNSASQ